MQSHLDVSGPWSGYGLNLSALMQIINMVLVGLLSVRGRL